MRAFLVAATLAAILLLPLGVRAVDVPQLGHPFTADLTWVNQQEDALKTTGSQPVIRLPILRALRDYYLTLRDHSNYLRYAHDAFNTAILVFGATAAEVTLDRNMLAEALAVNGDRQGARQVFTDLLAAVGSRTDVPSNIIANAYLGLNAYFVTEKTPQEMLTDTLRTRETILTLKTDDPAVLERMNTQIAFAYEAVRNRPAAESAFLQAIDLATKVSIDQEIYTRANFARFLSLVPSPTFDARREWSVVARLLPQASTQLDPRSKAGLELELASQDSPTNQNHGEFEEYAQDAAALFEAIGDEPNALAAKEVQAWIVRYAGDYKTALGIFKDVIAEIHANDLDSKLMNLVLESDVSIADCSEHLHDDDDALAALEGALGQYRTVAGPEKAARSDIASSLVPLYVKKNRIKEAAALARGLAPTYISRLEALRNQTPDVLPAARNDLRVDFAQLADALIRWARHTNEKADWATAFTIFQYATMAGGADASAQAAALLANPSALQAASLKTYRLTLETWSTADDAVKLQALSSGVSSHQLQDNIRDLDVARIGLEQATHDLQQTFPSYFTQAYPRPVTIDAVKARLAPHEAVLIYELEQPSYAWIITRESSTPVTLPSSIFGDIDAFNQSVNNSTSTFDVARSRRLGDGLIRPFLGVLSGISRLTVVPDFLMLDLPLPALLLGDLAMTPLGQPDYADAPWLIKRFALEETTSPSTFVTFRKRTSVSSASRAFLGVGDPDLQSLSGSSPLVLGLKGLPPSSLTGQTLRDIGKNVHTKQANLILAGPAATMERFESAGPSNYKIVAFSTHGVLSGELNHSNPESALIMTPQMGDPRSSLLTPTIIRGLQFDADVVLLGACDTGVLDSVADEFNGISALTSAFIVAGSRSVMVTLWRADDVAASDILPAMAAKLLIRKPGENAADALQAAVKEYLRGKTYDSDNARPYLWASYTVWGN
jgi:CHAT domain-containing protein